MAGQGVSTPAVAAAGVGALALWAAVKGASVTGGLRSLLGGHAPAGANVEPAGGISLGGGGGPGAGAGSAATGSAVSDAAMRYYGSGSVYLWGGATPKGWDCSGFCNYVIGHDLGSAIPGSPSGQFSGHGPVTMQWATFGTSVPRSQVRAGDLCVWPLFHMGIAISSTQMINCPGPGGTPAPVIGNIDGGGTGVLVCRRL